LYDDGWGGQYRVLAAAKGLHSAHDLIDVGCDERVVGNPGVADDAVAVQDEDRAPAHAPEAAERILGRVGDAELLDSLAVEVAEERERQAELVREGGVGTVALDAESEDTRAEGGESVVARTEPFQLGRSDSPEVEQVPGQDDRAPG
jgi:PAS domain-containing protein